jgi:hypothetical protein
MALNAHAAPPGLAVRILDLYVDPESSARLLADLGTLRLKRGVWDEALFTFREGLTAWRDAEGFMTSSVRDEIGYELNKGLAEAAVQLTDYETAASAYGRATHGSPIVDCFSRRPDTAGYEWACAGLYSADFCNPWSILDEAEFLDARSRVLMATERSTHAARLAWFASVAVVEHTRKRYTLDSQARSEFRRQQGTHQTFVSAAWAGSSRD